MRGQNRAIPGILRMFTQFRRMNETLADHLLNSRGRGLPGHRPRLPAPQSPGRCQHLAAINAVHTDPVTDWNQLLALYDQLARLDSSPSRKPWTGGSCGLEIRARIELLVDTDADPSRPSTLVLTRCLASPAGSRSAEPEQDRRDGLSFRPFSPCALANSSTRWHVLGVTSGGATFRTNTQGPRGRSPQSSRRRVRVRTGHLELHGESRPGRSSSTCV